MSLPQTGTEFAVSSDGVDVVKRLETDEFPVPTVAFDITSSRSKPVSVRIVDPVPDAVDPAELGFHVEYGEEHWRVEGERLVFESELSPNESYTTLYGIRVDDVAVDPFLTEPTAVDVTPRADPDPGETSLDDQIPDLESDESATDDEVASAVDDERSLADPVPMLSEEFQDEATRASNGETVESAVPTPDKAPADGVVAAFVSELRSGTVPEDQLSVIRAELQPADGSTDARIDKLQTDVADLRAYTGALETFLDDQGTGARLISDFEERLEALETTVASLQSAVASNEQELDSMATSVADVDSAVDRLQVNLDEARQSLTNVEEDIETLDDQIPAANLQEHLSAMRDDVETVKAFQETIRSAFGEPPVTADAAEHE